MRLATMVLPAPDEPMGKMLRLPAQATSSAYLTACWPRTPRMNRCVSGTFLKNDPGQPANASAVAKSKADSSLLTSAGARFIVMPC